MKLISYLCKQTIISMERNIRYSEEYMQFKATLNQRALEKLDYCIAILQTEMPLSQKFVKKIISSDFYELRVSVDNEIRVILFSADNSNISLATEIIVLNGFVKKSNKDYDKQIRKAYNILTSMI